MKKVTLALVMLLSAVSVRAQLLPPPPSATTHVPQLMADAMAQANDFQTFLADYNAMELWIKNSAKDLDTDRVQGKKDIQDIKNSISTINDNIQQMQTKLNNLLNAQTSTPITMHVEAESTATANVIVKPIQASSGGNKVVLAAGQRLTYNILVPATKLYVFTAQIGSDPGTQGTLTFHIETPSLNSGPMTAAGGGLWITSTAGQPMALTVGPVAITLVVDSPSITGGAFYIDFFEGSAKQ